MSEESEVQDDYDAIIDVSDIEDVDTNLDDLDDIDQLLITTKEESKQIISPNNTFKRENKQTRRKKNEKGAIFNQNRSSVKKWLTTSSEIS